MKFGKQFTFCLFGSWELIPKNLSWTALILLQQAASRLKSLSVTISSRFSCYTHEVRTVCNCPHVHGPCRHIFILASRLDYCNTRCWLLLLTYYNQWPESSVNAKVELMLAYCRQLLHWLPLSAKQRVAYKMPSLAFKMLLSSAPAYPSDLPIDCSFVWPLQSSDTLLLSVPRTWTELAQKAFWFVALCV